jgi:capsular polysaccharide biosynthesis protein
MNHTNDTNETDIVKLITTIWRYKHLVVAGTLLITLLGLTYTVLTPPIYHSEAIISPKKQQQQSGASSMLSQFGNLGGIVASQFGLGNTNMARLEVISKGRELAGIIVRKNHLLPKLFSHSWDSLNNKWAENNLTPPTEEDGIDILQSMVKFSYKDEIIKLGIDGPNPVLAKILVDYYLKELNNKISTDVKKDAEANKEYLEKQIVNTIDPIMQEKIQNMIAYEIEKSMMVSHKSFDILEKPIVAKFPIKPRKRLILLSTFFLGILVSTFLVLLYNFLRSSPLQKRRPLPDACNSH